MSVGDEIRKASPPLKHSAKATPWPKKHIHYYTYVNPTEATVVWKYTHIGGWIGDDVTGWSSVNSPESAKIGDSDIKRITRNEAKKLFPVLFKKKL